MFYLYCYYFKYCKYLVYGVFPDLFDDVGLCEVHPHLILDTLSWCRYPWL